MCSRLLKRLPHQHQGTNSLVFVYHSLENKVCIIKAADASRQSRLNSLSNEFSIFSDLGQVCTENRQTEQKLNRINLNLLDAHSEIEESYELQQTQSAELLWHPHIVRIFGYKKGWILEEKSYDALFVEFCKYGSLLTTMESFPHIFDPWRLVKERRQTTSIDFGMHIGLVKMLFKQLCSAVAFIHSRGFSHLDIQFSNILLGDDFQLKLCDFGDSYRQERKPNSQKEDIFQLGGVLFSLIFGEMLPKVVHPSPLKIIQFAVSNKLRYLQDTHLKEDLQSLISLITQMVQLDIEQRPSIFEIQLSPWLNENAEYQVKEVMSVIKRKSSKIELTEAK